MKVLNLYAGIGGNRKLWGDEHDITAVEWDKDTADVYKSLFPHDTVIIADAHEYLLNHYKEFDFIWSSPPCPTHSDIRRVFQTSGRLKPVYPKMDLYQEIILMMHFCKGKWCVENVKPYYTPLIAPKVEMQRHLFWCNFNVLKVDLKDDRPAKNIRHFTSADCSYGFSVKYTKIKDKRKAIRNLVNPELGLHILNTVTGIKYINTEQESLF